jgi:hypothetical protein
VEHDKQEKRNVGRIEIRNIHIPMVGTIGRVLLALKWPMGWESIPEKEERIPVVTTELEQLPVVVVVVLLIGFVELVGGR